MAKDFADCHDGQRPSSKTLFAPAWVCVQPLAARDKHNVATAYRWPMLPNSDTRHEAETSTWSTDN